MILICFKLSHIYILYHAQTIKLFRIRQVNKTYINIYNVPIAMHDGEL